MRKEIFVVKKTIFEEILKYVFPDYVDKPVTYHLSFEGNKIESKERLLEYYICQAEDNIKSTKYYQDTLRQEAIRLLNTFIFIKNKKKYSRAGKWIRRALK